ncbi:MAG: hypothetical protein WCV67_02165 [Victivallaceae bacterium]|jgi:hypothetical protein
MKSRWKLWGLVGLAMLTAAVAYATNGAQNITSTINTARFILFGGSYSISETRSENGVFKLDTYSGKTWILRASVENNVRVERWEPVSEADTEPPAIKQSTNMLPKP